MLRGNKLGEGTFGIVYEAKSPGGSEYAVKRNLAEEGVSGISSARELDILNSLRHHPHIARLEKVSIGSPLQNECFSPLASIDRRGQRDDSIHFVLGKGTYDLHQFIYGAATIDFGLIKRYMVHILLGVEYMHSQKIIHRDLKPSNVLIFGEDPDALDTLNVAKLCDFGLSKPYTVQGIQTPKTVTSWYRAPEITLGYPHYDYKIDVWAVGCILFEMIAKKAFVPHVPENNDVIVSKILSVLPTELPRRKFRELIRCNRWRKVKLSPNHRPRVRSSFHQKLNLSVDGRDLFQKHAGSIDQFCDLLSHMLEFDWNERYTISQALDHPFFQDFQPVIQATRKNYPLELLPEIPFKVRKCKEREWMAEIVERVFNNRHKLSWYTHRTIFQAMDLYDRYLSAMFRVTPIHPTAKESELKGFIHDKFNSNLRFMTCIYLCIKYFSSIHHPVEFDSIVTDEFKTEQAKTISENFEGGLVQHCLQYNIYRPTLFETADHFDYVLDEMDVCKLVVLYSQNHSFSGMTPTALFQHYITHLKDKDFEALYQPIQATEMEDTLLKVDAPTVTVPVKSY